MTQQNEERTPVVTPAKVRAIRDAMGLSVTRFAGYCYVTGQTIRNWESGRAPVRGTALVLLSLLGEKFDV